MTDASRTRRLHPAVAFALDLVLVLVFCAIGRASHDEAVFGPGYIVTAWPFVAGLLAGTLVALAFRRPLERVAAGAIVWIAAVAGGMILRGVSGQGTALPFVIVATISLAVLLFGWRLAALAVRRAQRERA
ncbi:DUF3054 domain-containing protein [Microbacterium sp. NPDC096154]|uniref:DUF3054 domain-containing protein n=1 Tax=Microbacterium sp. NPDC096154 TaxID=3155549 RepID=UPI003328D573